MKQRTKKLIIFAAIMLISAGCNNTNSPTKASVQSNYNYSHKLAIGKQILNVELADTVDSQRQGLSDRSSMQESQGMLFDFGKGAGVIPGFWMKDMKFNLDFIWISQNKIVGITPDILAPTIDNKNLPLYYPPSPVDQVLEVNAGWSKKNEIKIGDEVKLN